MSLATAPAIAMSSVGYNQKNDQIAWTDTFSEYVLDEYVGPPWVPELVIIAPSVWILWRPGDLSSRIQVFQTWRSNLFCHALDGCFAQTLMAYMTPCHILVFHHTIQDDNLPALPSRLFHPNETLSPRSIAVSHKWNP